jgi:glyoxylate reductase
MGTRRPQVLLTHEFPDAAITVLQTHVTLSHPKPARPFSRKEILERLPGTEGLICMLSDRIDKEMIEAGTALKIIANYAVGYNNIDIDAARKRGIVVTNTPDVLTDTTADLTFALILGIARRIYEADTYMRSGTFNGWAPLLMLGADVHHKTLGIIGFGRIGQAVAQRGRGFGMHILYHEPEPRPHAIERTYEAIYCDLDTLLREADFVSLHVPLTSHTHHMISDQQLSLMKPGAFLINVARGPVVDENALVNALKQGAIAGCALDVYEHEPRVARELIDMKNTILVPHIGSATQETRLNMAMMTVQSVLSVLIHKEPPRHLIHTGIHPA